MVRKIGRYFKWFTCPRCGRKTRFFYDNENNIPNPLYCFACREELYVPKFRVKRGAKKQITAELFTKLYYQENMTLDEIGKMFSVTKASVSKIARTLGIRTRTPMQARDLAIKLGKSSLKYKKVDTHFFSSWNSKMAYVLGFIYADGAIFANKSSWGETWGVAIGQKDREHLEKIKKLMQAEQSIVTNKKGLNLISICHKQIGNDLKRLGLTPNKSLTVRFPEVPDEHIRHFIRGVFDGDGTVSIRRFRIGTGSRSFAEALRQNLIKMLQVDPTRVQLYEETYAYRKQPFYIVNIRADATLEKLCHMLYDGVSSEECLASKRQRFEQAIIQSRRIQDDKSS